MGSDISVGNKFLVDSYFILWGGIVEVSVGVLMGLGMEIGMEVWEMVILTGAMTMLTFY